MDLPHGGVTAMVLGVTEWWEDAGRVAYLLRV
jgi:hypothetical protein